MQIFEQQNAVKMHFFDYSLWNHYVNVRLPPFMPETRPSLLSFILFLLCTFCTFCTFSLPLIHPNQTGETLSRQNRIGIKSLLSAY